MSLLTVDLPWLADPPSDYQALCRALGADARPIGRQAQFLASFRLSPRQSSGLSRALRQCIAAGADTAPLSPFKLGVLAGGTFDLAQDCMPAAAARYGVALELVVTPYDQVMQQALDPASPVHAARPDAVLIAVDHRWLDLGRPALDGGAELRVAEAMSRLRAVVDGLREHSGATAILQTLPAPPDTLFGGFDRRVAGSVRAMVEAANSEIVALADETGGYLFDVAALASRVGADLWFDPIQYLSYKLPFAAACCPAYADQLGRLLGAVRGRSRKCLVLDLDNTLWGGVVGDDGVGGIAIGQGSARGEAFLAVQQAALQLHDRGVMLAVCSKNDDATARAAFRDHPDMLLRESHITVFQANWLDKPSNLEAIAATLNIGVDALVFLDDNPAERAQVRAALPSVAVPELPEDPSVYAWLLSAAGYFEAVSFSAEDQLRIASYAADARRAEVRSQTRDLGDYLSSLAMTLRVGPFDSQARQRIAQLINKTNQFNLTTERHSEIAVAAMEADPSVFTLQARLADRFGDFGLIGVVICRRYADDPGVWDITSWLMSCRVLGRQVEQAVLDVLAAEARARGVQSLIGRYAPTAKNAMVADHYAKLGFAALASDEAGVTLWRLDVSQHLPGDPPMTISTTFVPPREGG